MPENLRLQLDGKPDGSDTGLAEQVQRVELALDGEGVAYLARVRQAAGRLSRRDAGSDDARAALEELQEMATVDVDVPTLSRRRSVRVVKGSVKQLGGWYMRYVGAQVTAFGLSTVRFGTALLERTDAIERSTEALSSEVAQLGARLQRLESMQTPLPAPGAATAQTDAPEDGR